MLIIPASRRPDWRNPPLITLLLILFNTLIFFGMQSGDEQRMEKAYDFYANSSLPKIELPRYVHYLEESGQTKKAAGARSALENTRDIRLLQAMESDTEFMKRLLARRIIQSEDSEYGDWQRLRNEFDRLKNASLIERFGFKPAQPTVAGFLGNMFLHGSVDHLLGNMAILFVVGCLVEETLGKRRYFAFYLLAGMGGTAFDWIFNASRFAPGIGASGAISGVMAMFVVLYGMRKIRFFYWVFIYFDFFTAPAIIVLPYWIANEIYQYLFNKDSMVNYMAHLGGFLAGTALVALQHRFGKKRLKIPQQNVSTDSLPEQIAKVDALLGDLRMKEALAALRRLAQKHPVNTDLLTRYYKVARHTPAGEEYHQAAALIFALPDHHPASAELIHDTFVDYLGSAKPTVRFSTSLLIRLIQRLARGGYPTDAERLTRVLARRAPQEQRLPGLLLVVAEAFRRTGNSAMRDQILARLQQEYPGSDEARNAIVIAG